MDFFKGTHLYWAFVFLFFTHNAYSLNILKGPYLQNVQKDGITIMWETDKFSNSKVCYRKAFDYRPRWRCKIKTKKSLIHKVVLRGLVSNTKYLYMIRSTRKFYFLSPKTKKSGIYYFKTAPVRAVPFSFYVWGDNQYGVSRFYQIKWHMEHPEAINRWYPKAKIKAPDFAICVGDIVDKGKSLKRWQKELFDPLDDFMKRVPVYDAIGNHELYGSKEEDNFFTEALRNKKTEIVQEIVDYYLDVANDNYKSEKQRSYYDRYFDHPNWAKKIRYFHFNYGNSILIFLDSNLWGFRPKDKQFQWLMKLFKSKDYKKAAFRFVFFHIPVINRVWDKRIAKEDLVHKSIHKNLLSHFIKNNVDIIFNGHAHGYQKGQIVNPKNGHKTYFMVTGGGGGNLDTVIHDHYQDIIKDQDIDLKHFHYLSLDVTEKEYQVTKIAFKEDDGSLKLIRPQVVIREKVRRHHE